MSYHQITYAERYTICVLRQLGYCPAAIARVLGRHRSSIIREVRRNRTNNDGCYRFQVADWYANGRRQKSAPQPPVHARPVAAGVRLIKGRLEPRTNRRLVASPPRARDQS